ncbi:MAG: FecR family protein [Kiritimatiellae bacterium]|nr:FecR family protein [Kiritimatiellia bacterium]
MKASSCSIRFTFTGVLVGFFLSSMSLYGQEASDARIIDAARRVHEGTATLSDKSVLINNNARLNTLGRSGGLVPGNPGLNQSYYNSSQDYFSRANQIAARRAAKEVGVSIRVQPRKPGQVSYNPGTDTDLIVYRGADGKLITKQQLDALDAAHQKHLKKILRSMGQTPPAGRIDANTDFMPHPDHTTRQTFQQQSNQINARGGAAYTDPAAVRVEYQMRNPNGPERISVSDAGRYVSQQQFHADRHFRAANQLNHHASSLEKQFGPNATAAQKSQIAHLRDQAHILQQNGAKYIDRINQVTDTVARQNHVTVSRGPETDAARAARRAAGPRRTLPDDPPPMGPKKISAVDMATAKTAGLSEQLTRKAVMAHADTMARIAAANPGQAAAARDSIARAMARLPPSQQGEILQNLERTAGKTFTSNVAKQARQYQRPIPPAATQTLTQRALEAVGATLKATAILNVAADIKEILTADDPAAVLAQKATGYADGLSGGSITTAEKLGDFEHLQVEHDAYLQGVERVLHQAIEVKLRRMGVDREEARRISNAFYRGDLEAFRSKARELKAAGIVDPHPERGGLEGVSAWDQDDTALERLLGIGEGILQAGQRAGEFAKDAVMETGEILVGLTESGVLKELVWERDPRLLIDIYNERKHAATQTALSREEMIAYLEALGASPVGARRATAALLDDGDVSDFRRLVAVLQDRRARREKEAAEEDETFDGEFGEGEEAGPEDLRNVDPMAVAEIIDATGVRIIRDPANVPEGALQEGSVVMTSSGSWVRAYGGWRTEENPPNHPKEVGPFAVRPGKYRVHLSYSPDIPASMTAGNWNTGMSVSFSSPGAPGARGVASIQEGARDKPSGEGSREFVIDRPGQIKVRFSMAASRGQAGGYAEHAQSYQGSITLLEPTLQETAEAGTEIASGDVIQVGTRDATVALWDGTLVTLRAGSEVRVEMTPEDRLRVTVLKGSGRFARKGQAFGSLEVVSPDGKNLVRPRGTDFIVSASGVEVVEGSVEITAEGQPPVAVEAGQRFHAETREIHPLELDSLGPALSVDGFPLLREYWMPDAEDFGEKNSRFAGNAVPGGWWLADPPLRTASHPLEIETPAEGSLRLTVPANSRLDDAGNTAPRLMHKVTGDFLLEAVVTLEGEGTDWAGLQFIARSPGSFAGSRHGHFPRTTGDGAGQHYWLGPYLVARTGGGVIRVPALNQSGHADWPEAGDGPVRLFVARLDGKFAVYWSLDGENWYLAALPEADLPETLWVGWAFVNTPHRQTPAVFQLDKVRLVTAPAGEIPPPAWSVTARNGRAFLEEDDAVRLVLDGAAPGSVRAFSGRMMEGDFDVEARFETGTWEANPGEIRRWSLAAVYPGENGLAVGCEASHAGQRYGLFIQSRPEFSTRTAFSPVSPVISEAEGRLRLKREGGLLTAYYWRGGQWEYWRAAPYRNKEKGEYAGPVYLRLEVSNGHTEQSAAPMEVRFDVQSLLEETQEISPPVVPPENLVRARRLLAEAAWQEARGEQALALEAYFKSLAFLPDEEIEAKIKSLDPARLAPLLTLGEPHRAFLSEGTAADWYRVTLPTHGDLHVKAEGYDILRFGLDILTEKRSIANARIGNTSSNEVTRTGLAPGDYFVRLNRSSGDGPYVIEARLDAQPTDSDPEPNDNFEQAKPIPHGAKSSGLLGYGNGVTHDRVDWHAIQLEAPGDLLVNVEGEDRLTNFTLYLHDVDGRRELGRDTGGMKNSRSVARAGLAPGTYFASVWHSSGHGAYQIHPKFTPSAHAEVWELPPNDTLETARNIPFNEKTTGLLGYGNVERSDLVDWFSITLETPGDLRVEIHAEDSLGNFVVYLYEMEGKRELARDIGGPKNSRVVSRAGLAAGTYHLQVRHGSGQGAFFVQPTHTPPNSE